MPFRRERVRIETARHEIEGTLQLPHEGFRSRMTDFLNTQGDDFLPLTDAEVTYLDGSRAPEKHEYLALATRHVMLVVELGSLGTVEEPVPDVQRVSAAARRLTASSTSSGVVPTFRRAKPAPCAPKSSPRDSATRPRSRNAAAGSSPSPPRGSPATPGSSPAAGTHAIPAAAASAAARGWRAIVGQRLVQPLVAVAERRLGRDRAEVARAPVHRRRQPRRRAR